MTSLSLPKLQKSLLRFGDGQSLLQSILENAGCNFCGQSSLETCEIHPSLTGEGGVRHDSFSNLFWSADLRCKLSAFEESWAVRCAIYAHGTHRTHLNCETSHVQDKREKRWNKDAFFGRNTTSNWEFLACLGATKHSRLCTKCHKTVPILSKLEFQSKYTDSQFMLTGEYVQNCCQVLPSLASKTLYASKMRSTSSSTVKPTLPIHEPEIRSVHNL